MKLRTKIRRSNPKLESALTNKKQKITDSPTKKSSTASIMLTLSNGEIVNTSYDKYQQAFKLLIKEGKVGGDDGATWPKITTQSIVEALNRVSLVWVEEALNRFKDPYWSRVWKPHDKRRMNIVIIKALQQDIKNPDKGALIQVSEDLELCNFYFYSAILYVHKLSYDIQASKYNTMDALKRPENYPALCHHFKSLVPPKGLSFLSALGEIPDPETECTRCKLLEI